MGCFQIDYDTILVKRLRIIQDKLSKKPNKNRNEFREISQERQSSNENRDQNNFNLLKSPPKSKETKIDLSFLRKVSRLEEKKQSIASTPKTISTIGSSRNENKNFNKKICNIQRTIVFDSDMDASCENSDDYSPINPNSFTIPSPKMHYRMKMFD